MFFQISVPLLSLSVSTVWMACHLVCCALKNWITVCLCTKMIWFIEF
jgi:hypothetical protein